MQKNKTKFILVLLIVALLFSSTFVFADNEEAVPISDESETNPVETSTSESRSNIQTQEDSYKKSDIYLTGDNVTIDYIVDGNLFVCANTVTINSQIGGDAFICTKNLVINEKAYVFNNLFVIADSIEVKGVVYDVYALAKNFNISKGYVYRDLKVSCNTLNVNGTVGRNAYVDCSNINFNTDENSNGIIYGNLDYSSDNEISFPENVVNGNINFTKDSSDKSFRATLADTILSICGFITFVLVIWLLLLWLAPKFLNNTSSYLKKNSLNTFVKGILGLIIIPVICLILILIKITSSVSLVLLALYVLALIVSKSLFTITANNYICSKFKVNKTSKTIGMLVISSFVVWVLTNIPYVGPFISLLIVIFGLGILITALLPKRSKKNEKEIIETK